MKDRLSPYAISFYGVASDNRKNCAWVRPPSARLAPVVSFFSGFILIPRNSLSATADIIRNDFPFLKTAVEQSNVVLYTSHIVLGHLATLATRNITQFEDLSVPVVNPWLA